MGRSKRKSSAWRYLFAALALAILQVAVFYQSLTKYPSLGLPVNATGTKQYSGSTTSQNYTNITIAAGSNRGLVLTLNYGGTAPTSITAVWDSGGSNQSMTQLVYTNIGSRTSVIFGLRNPITGNKTLAIAWTGSAEVFSCAIAFNGVEQSSDAKAFLNTSSNSLTGGFGVTTIPVVSDTGNSVVACQANATGTGTSTGTNLYTDSSSGAIINAQAEYDNGGSPFINIGSSGTYTTMVAVEVRASGATLPIWLMSTFKSGTNNLMMMSSNDGTSWSLNNSSYTPNGGAGTLRDPHAFFLNNDLALLLLSHTINSGLVSTAFGFAYCTSAPTYTFTATTDVDCSNLVSGAGARIWSPRPTLDATAPCGFRIYFTYSSTGGSDTAFQIGEVHPTDISNLAAIVWSTPVAVGSSGLPNNMIDADNDKIGSTYYLWFKNENTKLIEVASSSAATSSYTSLYTGDWMGIGSPFEGPDIVDATSVWRLYVDDYTNNGVRYTEQTKGAADWTGTNANAWSAVTDLVGVNNINNGNVVLYPTTPVGDGQDLLGQGAVLGANLLGSGTLIA